MPSRVGAAVSISCLGGGVSAPAGGEFALEFPTNISGSDTTAPLVALKFVDPHLDGLPLWGPGGGGVTVIMWLRSLQQQGYYARFWHYSGSLGFDPTVGYWGFHPYPQNQSNTGETHWWEIASDGGDFIDADGVSAGAGGSPTTVVQDTNYIQAMEVTRNNANSKVLKMWHRLPLLTSADYIRREITTANYGEVVGANAQLMIGDSPWYASYQHERAGMILDAIKIFGPKLSESDMALEGANRHAIVTAAGLTNVWYYKDGFDTVDDLECAAGTGRSFVWADGSNKGTLASRLTFA